MIQCFVNATILIVIVFFNFVVESVSCDLYSLVNTILVSLLDNTTHYYNQ